MEQFSNNNMNNNDNTNIKTIENSSILEDASYTLSTIKKSELEENSFTFDLENLAKINDELKEFASIFQKKDNKGENLYQINNLKDPKAIISFFNDPKNKNNIKHLNKMGFNPATIMIAISLSEIEKEIIEIKSICNNILSFLENDKESEIEADVKTLIRVITEYKYNWQDEQYINNNHKLVMDIKRTGMKNINFYQKQIYENMKKKNIFMTNKTINYNQNELEKNFSYYRLSLYVYSFATFLEIMLLENFQKEYLLSKREEIETLSNEYINNYQEALKYVKKEANKSIQGNLLSGIGSAGKAIGDLSEKIQVIKDKKIDTWFNKNSDNIKNVSQNMKNNFSLKFEEMNNPNTKIFIDKIKFINDIYNNVKNIYFDNKKLYLEIMK